MNIPLILGAVVVGILLLLFWKAPADTRFIGYGWKLRWCDGQIVVVSRLLDSPSGRAGVRIGSIVLEFDGHPMVFDSGESFVAFMKALPRPALGTEASFRLMVGTTERVVTLKAEMIQPPIPTYGPLPPLDPADAHLVTEGMLYCLRTGQVVPVRHLSRDAVRDL